jgi:putative transposase
MVSEKLVQAIENIIPKKSSKVGRPRKPLSDIINGIIFVLKTGCQWAHIPRIYGARSTIHGYFIRWSRMGIMKKIHQVAVEYYEKKQEIDNWFAFDCSSKKAPLADYSGKNPTDRGKRGIKHVVLVDRVGAPLAVDIIPANTHDSKAFIPLINSLKQTEKIRIIAADSAFDAKKLYKAAAAKNLALVACINPRRDKTIKRTKVLHRWVVEQTFGIFSWFRGLKTCWAKTKESHLGFLQLASAIRLFQMC